MSKIKVKVKEPIIKVDQDGFVLDVSQRAFNENPQKVYSVPNTIFWLRLRDVGLLISADKSIDEENPVLDESVPKKEGKKHAK